MAEFASIAVVLAVVLIGRARRWHERWIDYRLAAELLRHLRVLAPLGGARPFPQVPAHQATHGHPASTWMEWYVRAVARKVGLPEVAVNQECLQASLAHLSELPRGQQEVHETTARHFEAIAHRLHVGIVVLLVLTPASCLAHLLGDGLPGGLLTFGCGFFPALGACLAGIINQGEFRRVAKRSEAMGKHLAKLVARADTLAARPREDSQAPQLAVDLDVLATDAVRVLVHEVLDWRVLFLDRPLEVGT